MKRFAAGILIMFVAVSAVFVVMNRAHGGYDPSAPYQEKIDYWQKRIHEVGGKRAYDEMARAQQGAASGVEHVEAHIFGSALYRTEGIKGVSVCDDQFSYACVHQLVAEALSDLGIESLDAIVAMCIEIPGCRHGIGHGVIGSLGYGSDDLKKAVSMCATLPRAWHVQGCYGGVFMEYNVRTLLGVGQERPLEQDWFESCRDIPRSAERSCYFWQPTWWGRVLRTADRSLEKTAIEQMSEQCRMVSNKELRAVCFEGIGVSALNTGRSLNDGVSGCSFVGTDMRDRALCLTSVARYIELDNGRDTGRPVCLGLTGAYQEGCLRDIGNTSTTTSYFGEKLSIESVL